MTMSILVRVFEDFLALSHRITERGGHMHCEGNDPTCARCGEIVHSLILFNCGGLSQRSLEKFKNKPKGVYVEEN